MTEERELGGRNRSSAWGSEESREFLQERIGRFAGPVLLITLAFFVAGWAIAATWAPDQLSRGLPVTPMHLFNLACIAVYLVMWLATRGRPLPGPVLHVLDGAGTVLACILEIAMSFALPMELRPDLLAVIGVFGLLLYRAAIVPSDPRRTAWIGVLSALPLPFVTYMSYERGAIASLPHPAAYASYALLFGALAVLLSTKTSSVIYGLRQTVREARRLGPYTLVEKIGEGGMGAVYRASHALLRRPTAIKILPPQRAGQMDLARFEREVQMTSQLTSPHTVSVYDYGRTPDGLFYYAMEFLDGIDLEELVRRDGPMPPERVVHILRQVCEALGEAHRAGLIHRDVKPANILLCERGGRFDVAKVVDFGLVKSVGGTDPGVTQENTAPGTPHYMAPEALTSPDRVDARADVYSLGATAYFLLTGQNRLRRRARGGSGAASQGVALSRRRRARTKPSGKARGPRSRDARKKPGPTTRKRRGLPRRTARRLGRSGLDRQGRRGLVARAGRRDQVGSFRRQAVQSGRVAPHARYRRRDPTICGPRSAAWRIMRARRRPAAARPNPAPTAVVDVAIDRDARRLSPVLAARLRRHLRRMVAAAARHEGRTLEAAFRITTDPVIHALNRDFRRKNKPTDVLAFAQREGPAGAAPPGVLGDVIVSIDTAARQARRRGPVGLWTEVRFLAAHGLCHLLGYDHNDDAEEATMNARMAALLAEADRRGPVRPA